MDLAAAIKRQFLELAFFPNGGDICKELGLVPSSDDVEQQTLKDITVRMVKLYTETGIFDDAFQMAYWYCEGARAAETFGHSQRTGVEHLVSFLMAAVAAGVVVLPDEGERGG
jgi:hypothetical protein